MYHTSDGVHVGVAPTYAIVCTVTSHNSQRPRSFHISLRFGNMAGTSCVQLTPVVRVSCVTLSSLAGVSSHAARADHAV